MKLFEIFKKKEAKKRPGFITVVSGLPRSGTSMMMQMIQAGGMEIVTDMQRVADDDNPRGYLELERVKKLKDGDTAWVETAQGKAVKVISALLEYLPSTYQYRILFMQREMAEILASQKQMLIRRGEPVDSVSDVAMAELFERHLNKVYAWLDQQENMRVLYVPYTALLNNPDAHIAQVIDFLGKDGGIQLNGEAMRSVPDRQLHRQRSQA